MARIKKAIGSDEKRREQELAWIGDCVLELFSRSWILKNHGKISGEMAIRMTSNQFLANSGNPTAIEAKIGKIYESEGLEPAFLWIEQELLPLFEKQERKRR
jgi:dsRNA-specific ribonuclease